MNKAKCLKKAAVIVLVEETSNSLVLTRRTKHLKHHAGEICFPGGQQQSEDSSLLATALRELEEELGIKACRVFDLKEMPATPTLTGFIIHPWLGRISILEPMQIDSGEVDEVVRIPLEFALQKENYQTLRVEKQGYQIKTLRIVYDGAVVWGASARIMLQLCDLMF